MTELFASAFALGLLFNAMPGAIFAESLRRGLRGGFRAALAIQIGSLAGDLAWAVLGLTGAATLFALPLAQTPLSLAGAALLLWISWQALRDAFRPLPGFEPATGDTLGRSALAAGAALSLSNPTNITYWAGLGGTVAALGVSDPGWSSFAIFLAGFMTSSVLWCFLCAGAIAIARRFVGARLWRGLNLACAAGLAGFALLIVQRTLA